MYGINNNLIPTQIQQPQLQPQIQPQNYMQDERVWVSNQQGAESFLLAPNSFVRLWDSSTNRFYERRSDINGRPLPMEIYEYKRVIPQTNDSINEANKILMDDINARFEAISERIDLLEQKKGSGKNGKQSNADDTSVQ